jgi:hypothetical protein
MTIPLFDAWVLSRLVANQPLSGELAAVSLPWRPMAKYLADLEPGSRTLALRAMLAARSGGEEFLSVIAAMDPLSPAPEPTGPPTFATVADVRRILAQTRWTWEGWIPAGRVVGVAAFEGTGKTRFLLDLARRIYFGEQWPDGQAATLPPGTRTLWICSDGHQDELAEVLPAFGLPDDAIVFPTPPDEPYDGTDIDDPAFIDPGGTLETAIQAVTPGPVIIDTLTNATRRDLCAQDQMKGLKTPLVRLVQQYQTNIILSLHLNREGQALGRRIKGITRTLIHLECPDPQKPERLRLWVEKSYAKKPPALGVTIEESGNRYDSDPPSKAEPSKGGRPPEKREEAARFIRESLSVQNDRIGTELCEEWQQRGGSPKTFWRAVDDLRDDGELRSDGGPGTRKQMVLHLEVQQPPPSPDPVS